ncbi:hypothetical protein ACO3TA_01725 [Methanocaldococcus sp. 28A]
MQDGKTKLKYEEVRDLLSLSKPKFPKCLFLSINDHVWRTPTLTKTLKRV